MSVELVTVPDVELASTGTHVLKSGTTTLTREDLASAIEAAKSDPAVIAPRAKLAHETQFDTGEPSFGVASNLRLRDDGGGKATIVGDWIGCPKWLAEAAPSALPNRSIEGERDWQSPSGKTHKLVISAFGLLGVTMPGIAGLKDLATWYGGSMPKGVVLAAYGDAAQLHTKKEPTPMPYPKAMLDKLGLPEDAADDVVLAKLDDLDKLAKGDPVALKAQIDAEVKKAVDAAAEKAKTDAAAAEEKAKLDAQKQIDEARAAALEELKKNGLTVVDAAALEELKTGAAAGAKLSAEAEEKRRGEVITAAIGKGKIAPARRDDMEKALASGAIDEATIDALPDNVVPVEMRGQAADPITASAGDNEVPLGWYTDSEVETLTKLGRLKK